MSAIKQNLDRISCCILLLLINFAVEAQMLKPGSWRGEVFYQQDVVPFTFEVSYPGGDTPRIVLVNGSDKMIVENAYLKGDNSFKWWTIGLSVMATQASAITFLSTPILCFIFHVANMG